MATIPPAHFFSGFDREHAIQQISTLRELGAAVYAFDVEPAHFHNEAALQVQIDAVRAFRPDAVIGTPHGGYALGDLMIHEHSMGWKNLFLDIFDLPTIFYWDHVLIHGPTHLMPRWAPDTPQQSERGVLAQMRALMRHPRAFHFFPDSGHIEELQKLGIANFGRDSVFVPPVMPGFVNFGDRSMTTGRWIDEVAFFGNVYLTKSERLPYRDNEQLMEIRHAALAICEQDWSHSAYSAFTEVVNGLDRGARDRLRLDRDQSFYWRYLYDELSIVANGELRLQNIKACRKPVSFFGSFTDPMSRAPIARDGFIMRDMKLQFGDELAGAYNQTRVAIDIVNAPYINGYSTKFLSCFAAGGFMLMNRKDDLRLAIGSIADRLLCSSPDEFAEKVDYFLGHDRERAEISKEVREIVRRDCSAVSLFARTIPLALDRLKAIAARTV